MTHQARLTPFLQIKGSTPQLKPCGQLRFTAKEVWPDNNGRGGAHQTLEIAYSAPSTDTLAVQVSNQAMLYKGCRGRLRFENITSFTYNTSVTPWTLKCLFCPRKMCKNISIYPRILPGKRYLSPSGKASIMQQANTSVHRRISSIFEIVRVGGFLSR